MIVDYYDKPTEPHKKFATYVHLLEPTQCKLLWENFLWQRLAVPLSSERRKEYHFVWPIG